MVEVHGANAAITAHNIGIFAAAALHTVGALFVAKLVRRQEDDSGRFTTVAGTVQ